VRLKFQANEWKLWRDVPKAAMSAVMAAIVSRWILDALFAWPQIFRLASCGIAFVVVYGVCLLVTRTITYGDFSTLLQVIRPAAPAALLSETAELEEIVY
jgi:hypothetical protein